MKIYNYDDTGVYVCESQADPDPKGSGFLIPRNATTLPPPTALPGTKLVYSQGAWSVVPVAT